MVGADQMVGSGLGGRIGTVGAIGCLFREQTLGTQAAVDFVGTDVMENLKSVRVLPGNFEEVEGPDDVRMDEALRPSDRTVHVGFGGKVADGVDFMAKKNFLHQSGVADIGLYKYIAPGISGIDAAQVFRIPRIGQLVHIDNPPPEFLLCQKVMNEIAADETATAGYHQVLNFHAFPFSEIAFLPAIMARLRITPSRSGPAYLRNP